MKNTLAQLLCLMVAIPALGGEQVDYATQIKPILAERCFACHGALKQQGGLRLDAAVLIRKGGDSGQALVEGKPADSLILQKVTTGDPDSRMPPAGKPLTKEEIALLRAWVAQGAKAPKNEAVPRDPKKHWAFQPPRSEPPPATSAAWIRNDIDRFVAALHEKEGLRAVGPARPATLLRRVYLDLIGLPPTRKQLRAFLDDKSPRAFERAVDGLLASPLYGQRWARHWMDVWRYSDPSGYGEEIRDGRRHIWRWRDWIVDSLNDDKGYDRMVVEMLAADEVAASDSSALRATGFLARNWYKFNRNVWLDNIVEHSSKAFLGLTANCARCHDHKYDPITQREYFQLRAIFEAHDVRDDPHGAGQARLVRAFDAHGDRPTFLFVQGNEQRPDKKQRLVPEIPAVFGRKLKIEPIQLPPQAFYPALQSARQADALSALDRQIAKAKAQLASAEKTVERAERKLAGFVAPREKKTREAKPVKSGPSAAETILADSFSRLDNKRWTTDGGNWVVAKGRLVQDHGESKQHRLISRVEHPRDFRAKVRLRITGGEMWRSVGLGFDGHGKAMNAVYLSAFQGGSKVQVTVQDSAGKWAYPQVGAKRLPVRLNKDYLLEILVRGRLMNVLVDGRLLVTFTLPANRKAGRVSIFTFSAAASFDDFLLTTLKDDAKLAGTAPAVSPQPVSRRGLRLARDDALVQAKIAGLKVAALESARTSQQARFAAERAKHGLVSGDYGKLSATAGQAERAAEISKGEELVAVARQKIVVLKRKPSGDAVAKTARVAAEKSLADHTAKLEKARSRPLDGSSGYQPIGTVHAKTSTGRRLHFARWITHRSNPLAARVAVNHVWLRHFGAPLVERVFDFGLRSGEPRHARLLDWLAVRFMDGGWSMKRLHKLIVTSGVYRRSSSNKGAPRQNGRIDVDNHLLWRHNVRRMDAEVVRDSLLHVGGSLETTEGGPPIDHKKGQSVHRRSLYFRQDKERQMVFLSLFDGAKVNECYRRKPTVAPQQALAMYNSKISAVQAERIAARIKLPKDTQFVAALFETILSRAPTDKERQHCLEFLRDFGDPLRARRQLALVLLNHNGFITIR